MQSKQVARRLLSVTFAGLLAAVFAPGCNGLSLEEATERCEADRSRLLTCPEDTFGQCVSCYEECGNDCTLLDTQGQTASCTYTCD